MKKLSTLLFLIGLALPTQADWPEYTYAVSLSEVDLSYRIRERPTGSDVQYKVFNHNIAIKLVSLERKIYLCHDGETDRVDNSQSKVRGKRGLEFVPDYAVCEENGGARAVQFIFKVKNRGLDSTEKIEISF